MTKIFSRAFRRFLKYGKIVETKIKRKYRIFNKFLLEKTDDNNFLKSFSKIFKIPSKYGKIVEETKIRRKYRIFNKFLFEKTDDKNFLESFSKIFKIW